MAFRLAAQQLRTHAVRSLYTAATPPTSTPRAFGALHANPVGPKSAFVLSGTGISACGF